MSDVVVQPGRYLVRTAGAESNIVHTVECDGTGIDGVCLTFYLRGRPVYVVGLARLIDVRPA